MYFEFLEDKLWERVTREQEDEGEQYIPGKGNFLKKKSYSQEEIDDIFDKIDVNKMNEKLDE